MEFNTREELAGEVIVIEAPERLEASLSSDFRAKIGELVDKGKYKLVIDLSKTDFMDSSGLGALVSRIAVARSNQGDIRLSSPKPYILQLLETTNLNKVFKHFDDVRLAIASF